MKQRSQTQVTVWPAITDLVITILVVALISGAVIFSDNPINDCPIQVPEDRTCHDVLNDSIQVLTDANDALSDSLHELQRSNNAYEVYVDSLRDSTQVSKDITGKSEGPGDPSCLGISVNGQPLPLITIWVNPSGRYQIRQSEVSRLSYWYGLHEYIRDEFEGQSLTKNQVMDFGQEIRLRLGDRQCVFFVTLQNGGVSQDSLILRWTGVSRYFGGLTNPNILY